MSDILSGHQLCRPSKVPLGKQQGLSAAARCHLPELQVQVRPDGKCPVNESPVFLVAASGAGLLCGDVSHKDCLGSPLGIQQNGSLRNL